MTDNDCPATPRRLTDIDGKPLHVGDYVRYASSLSGDDTYRVTLLDPATSLVYLAGDIAAIPATLRRVEAPEGFETDPGPGPDLSNVLPLRARRRAA